MKKRVSYIVHHLEDKKAENIEVFDMKKTDYFVDQVVIANTLGERHGLALLEHLKVLLKKNGESVLNIEASPEWSIIDLGDILIHLLTPEYREKYNLEDFLAKRSEEIKSQKN